MRIACFSGDPKIKGIKPIYIDDGVQLYPIYRDEAYVGMMKFNNIRRSVTLISGREKYKFNGHGKKCYIFICYSDIRLRIDNRYKQIYNFFKKIELPIMLDLGVDISDEGSWISIGTAKDMIEIWPINISAPYVYILKVWSKIYNFANLILYYNNRSIDIKVKLKNKGIINISDSFLIISDKLENLYIEYMGERIDLFSL